jgi:hypothetical protein
MTSYFDEKDREVNALAEASESATEFLESLKQIEAEVIHEVSLVTGDREFPNGMREAIQGCIASKAIQPTKGMPENEGAKDWATSGKCSQLLMDLHSHFHRVSSRRIRVRFGLLTDNPRDILARRDEHDKEAHSRVIGWEEK